MKFLFTNSAVGGTGSLLSEGAPWLAFAAFAIVGLMLARAGAPVLVALLLAAAGVLVQIAHTNPYGPLEFTCVLVAATMLVPWRARLAQGDRRLTTDARSATADARGEPRALSGSWDR